MRLVLLLYAVLGLVLAGVVRADEAVEVITLKYRTADELIPVISPLVDKGGAVTGMQNRLIVRTSPANLQSIRKVVESIDTAPRRLLITVKQDADLSSGRDEAEVSGRVRSGDVAVKLPPSGDKGGVTVQGGSGEAKVRARVLSTQATESDRNAQSLQVLEGREAYIQVGQSIPIADSTVIRTPGAVSVTQGVQYRDVTTGFYVRPRIAGDVVTLEVSPQRDTMGDPGTGSVNLQRAATVVSGRLGEWIEVGGVGSRSEQSASGIGSRSLTTATGERRILLKVEELR